MTLRFWTPFAIIALAAVGLRADDPQVLRIGVSDALMQEVPPSQRKQFEPQFTGLVREFTNLKSVILPGLDPFTSARRLDAGKWHLGVLPGVEFAWVHPDHPKLIPLMVMQTDPPEMRAVLVAGKDSAINTFSDLKGATIYSWQSKLHCRLFMEKNVQGPPQDYFGKLLNAGGIEDTLDDFLRGKAKAVITDTVALQVYKNLYPGRYARLKIVAQSNVFPPSAIVYHEGTLSDAMLNVLRGGLIKANQSDSGREAMAPLHITAFTAVPKNYEQSLAEIAKAYPAKRE